MWSCIEKEDFVARKNHRSQGSRPSANPEQAHWMRELRKSSAAQPHTPKPRKGTRRERNLQAIREQREH